MTVRDHFLSILGAVVALAVLLVSTVESVFIEDRTGNTWALALPFVVLVGLGFAAWLGRRKKPNPFLTGLIIGASVSLLLYGTCNVISRM